MGASRNFSWKSTPNNNFSTIQPISTDSIPIDSARQPEERGIIKNVSNLILGEQPGNFHTKSAPNNNFSTVQPTFADIPPIVSDRQVSTEKLPPHHHFLVNRVGKTANINGKKLLSLQPVVRTRRCYMRVRLIKRQKSFQGIAMYGHEVLMSLQTRAKFFGTHSTMWIIVPVTRDFNMTWYLVVKSFFWIKC